MRIHQLRSISIALLASIIIIIMMDKEDTWILAEKTKSEKSDTIFATIEVKGSITKHDAAAHTFKLNALTINYSSAKLQDFPAKGISNGQPVKVRSTPDKLSGSVLKAKLVKLEPLKFNGVAGEQCPTNGICN